MILLQYNTVQAEGEHVLEGGGHTVVNSTAQQETKTSSLDSRALHSGPQRWCLSYIIQVCALEPVVL